MDESVLSYAAAVTGYSGRENGFMETVEWIRNHPLYQTSYEQIRRQEQDRRYCGHLMDHFLDVARIAYIRNLEQRLGLSKELIYSAALLHDIGRARQYSDGTPHDQASADIAAVILGQMPAAIAFSAKDIQTLLAAIGSHRRDGQPQNELARLLQVSDKLSRRCFQCLVQDSCHWDEDMKNKKILV
jgi:uncharacterized protein